MDLFDKTLTLTNDDIFFMVKGYSNEKNLNAILKYYPTNSETPTFNFEDKKYTWNREDFNKPLIQKFPQYYNLNSSTLLSLDETNIKQLFNPFKRLEQIKQKSGKDILEKKTCELVKIFADSNINEKDIGITGTLLIGCHKERYSDIDLLIKGRENFIKAIKLMKKDDRIGRFSEKDWLTYFERYKIASTYKIDFKHFVKNASEKYDRGIYQGTKFSLFNIRNKKELRSEETIKNLGNIQIGGRIIDETENSFSPAFYGIEVNKSSKPEYIISEIKTMNREHYLEGYIEDVFECTGRLQEVTSKSGKTYFRVEVGYIDQDFIKKGTLNII